MSQKNYYQILHINPQASAAEIKSAYRKLALKYHPDRNNGNTFTEAVFKEIVEAYSILSNPQKRTIYNNSNSFPPQQQKREYQQRTITSHTLLQEAFRVKIIVEKSNSLTINRDALLFKTQALLSDHHLNILLLESNKRLISQYLHQVLICMQPLTAKSIEPLLDKLKKLAAMDEALIRDIASFYHGKKRDELWQQYKVFIVLAVAIILCCLMYIMYS